MSSACRCATAAALALREVGVEGGQRVRADRQRDLLHRREACSMRRHFRRRHGAGPQCSGPIAAVAQPEQALTQRRRIIGGGHVLQVGQQVLCRGGIQAQFGPRQAAVAPFLPGLRQQHHQPLAHRQQSRPVLGACGGSPSGCAAAARCTSRGGAACRNRPSGTSKSPIRPRDAAVGQQPLVEFVARQRLAGEAGRSPPRPCPAAQLDQEVPGKGHAARASARSAWPARCRAAPA